MEGPHVHEAVDTSRSRALVVVSAVAPLLALDVDVHLSGRLAVTQANHPGNPMRAAACCG